jgi:hypothetical protein
MIEPLIEPLIAIYGILICGLGTMAFIVWWPK